MKRNLLLFALLLPLSVLAQKTVTLSTLLKDLGDYGAVAKWPDPMYKEMQASSYDRKSVSPDQPGWFANDDRTQYIREETNEGRKERVMMDVDGPGAIVRFWLTTYKRNGNIRIYFDGQTTPEITIPAYDLMKSGLPIGSGLLTRHSSYEAKEKGGSNLYLPMPYAKHCKVTFEELEKNFEPRYYQINYRQYPKGTKVETFTLKQLESANTLVAGANYKLSHPPGAPRSSTQKNDISLASGKSRSLALPPGPNAVRWLTIDLKTEKPEDRDQALRSVVLKMVLDGEQTVNVPVGDFGGAGAGAKRLQSFYRTIADDGKIISRWVMPYQKSGELILENTGDINVSLTWYAYSAPWQWDARSMYFHADWKNEEKVPFKHNEENKPTDWTMISITGKGVFVGDALAVYNHSHKWYGEGDQKLWIDGEKFPSEFGTGAEDYYNTSWAPVVLYQTPFANAPRADNPDSFGHNTFTRTRNLDAVPFTNSFKYTLETLGWENNAADFAPTIYWYGFKGAKSDISAQPMKPGKLPQ
ncbi:glycoside hydrolase family 172 protein [Mucilaginibacter myungsuensis]|uniref:DUF2961 domain-containing protein n=1 Tax=Mucilaginibacter myungsuensis TaxID=649104 RepID=A0A929L129_9SPHI|nr:glycoside hydrolase family 172 protein [Mucilaginibacter myungsuensis]MBE9664300.1 DUF2961 domain-containing protein [Mucilaginibacter myungsuensis]MDN3597009.1 DUF2961 domain-containing protein [Mucilaginibacter myungsuensis]